MTYERKIAILVNNKILIKALAEEFDMTQINMKKIFDRATDMIKDNVAAGNKVSIAGFGMFDIKKAGGREGVDPNTHERTMYPVKMKPVFRPSKAFVNLANERKKKNGKKNI